MAEVEIRPAQALPRTPEEAHWMKEARRLVPLRHRGKMWRTAAAHAVRQVRAWRDSYRKDS